MSIGHAAVLCGRKGNRRSGVTLAMRYRFCGRTCQRLIRLRDRWPKKGRWAPRLHPSLEYGQPRITL